MYERISRSDSGGVELGPRAAELELKIERIMGDVRRHIAGESELSPAEKATITHRAAQALIGQETSPVMPVELSNGSMATDDKGRNNDNYAPIRAEED